MSTEIITAIIGAISGGFGWNLISTKIMPKKEQKESEQNFIETLLDRIKNLEGRLDLLTAQCQAVMEKNATLVVEMNYLMKENDRLQEIHKDLN